MKENSQFEFPKDNIWKAGEGNDFYKVFVPSILADDFNEFVKNKKIKIKQTTAYNYQKGKKISKIEKKLNEGFDYLIESNDVGLIKRFMQNAYKGIK